MNPSDAPLTVAEIRHLLPQLGSGSDAAANPNDSTERLQRLMEIYCVVKAGGVKVQTEAAQAHLHRELAQLEADLAAAAADDLGGTQSASLRQEMDDLRRSVNWRLSRLHAIDPEEEAAVVTCLGEIEEQVAGKQG